MTQQTDMHTLAVKVGEISGQLREMIHRQSNMEQKLDGLVERGFKSATTDDIEKLTRRIEALEAEKNRNDGAKGVFASILKSPVAAWVAAIVAAVFGAIKGGYLE
ncbi:hypothetical protein [Sphingopyxis terrae]|uniref:hypothetical protein n=1 Tax=Sphingopyxis terrae TaxID=33052 RepID=UPI0013C40A6A|nr:hypothetical protein [Sphingopyxis terrae]